jgi:succinate-semialdehyde dehydrogenase/glutarate-semialdehyde dehydrogenase
MLRSPTGLDLASDPMHDMGRYRGTIVVDNMRDTTASHRLSGTHGMLFNANAIEEMTEMATNNAGRIFEHQADVYPRVGLLIDGEWIYDRPACHQVLNPSDETVLGTVPGATEEDIDRALEAARRGFEVWRNTPPAERAAILVRTAALVRARVEEIAHVITLEQGKTIAEARGEVIRASTFLDWDSQQLLRSYGRIVPSEHPLQQFVVKEPIGPVAAFTPWNVPISSPSRKLSGSIAAGCSVIIKPAEETPATCCMFAQCFLDAGLPPGVLNMIFGRPGDVSARLIASPVIRMITLTGSVAVGKHLTRLAADGMKPVLMELGGHAPVLIDQDVDPIAVAKLATEGKFKLAGQFCTAPSRFIIHKNVYRDFIEAFAEGARAIRVGDGFTESVEMGPVASERRLTAISALVDDAVSRGANVAAGGHRIGNRGYFYAPTVLTDVPLDADVMHIEPFGPIAACVPMNDLEEGLALANNQPVGLAAYVFTNSVEVASVMSREIQCGSVAINVFTSPGADAPFGGYKESGIGREGGEESLDSYMVIKTITTSNTRV